MKPVCKQKVTLLGAIPYPKTPAILKSRLAKMNSEIL